MYQNMNYAIARSTHEDDLRRARERHEQLLHEQEMPQRRRGRNLVG